MTLEELVRQAHARHAERLLAYPGVVWVGIGVKKTRGRETGELAVVVGVRQKMPAADLPRTAIIPARLRHSLWALRRQVRTDVVDAGTIRALTAWTQRWRPVPAGVSIGHFKITAGTLGAFVWRNGQRMLLSNNHVLALSGEAAMGDAVLQPGPHDGGGLDRDTVARLEAFVPIVFDGAAPGLPDQCRVARAMVGLLNAVCRLLRSQTRYYVFDAPAPARNYVDAAVAQPLSDADLDGRTLDPTGIPAIAAPMAIQSATLGLPVRKSGRTTGWTEGRVTAIQVTVRVQYGEGKTATFEDQVVIEQAGFSAGGDSGSAITSPDGRLVGLLFAGSEGQTVFNRAERVFEALGLSL